MIQYFPVRLFALDPIRACSVVNKVEKLDRNRNSIFRLAPFAAFGGERGKAENCNWACESSFSTSFTTEQARMGSKSKSRRVELDSWFLTRRYPQATDTRGVQRLIGRVTIVL